MVIPIRESNDEVTLTIERGGETLYVADIRLAGEGEEADYCVPLDLEHFGASKRDVSRVFNAETLIIGFAAGFIGIAVTLLFCIPINLILHRRTGISGLSAQLPVSTAAVLVTISMLLTLIAGIIPSRSAAKKDPVVALRTG